MLPGPFERRYTAPMRKLWLTLALLLLLLPLAAVAILWLSPAALTQALQWGVAHLSPYRLEVSGLEVMPGERRLRFDELYLHQQGASGAPLLAVLDFEGETRFADLWDGELRHTELSLGSAIIYVSGRDEAADPSPRDWLQYLRWLPRHFAVDQLHIISDAEDVNILPFLGLQGERRDRGGFVAQGRANLPQHALSLSLELGEVEREDEAASVTVAAEILSPDGSRARVDGEFRALADDIAYDFSLDARYPSVAAFLEAFPAAPELAGSLTLSGRVRGDAAGFALTDASFALDNLPDYRFEASGSLAGATGEDPALSLIASGELANMDLLLTWVGVDLSPLGSARASIALSGRLGAPAVDQMTLVTSSSEGLWLSINGSSGPGSLTSVTVPRDSDFSVYLDAPSLGVLQPWLASELPLDPGPWELTGRLRERDGQLALEEIRGRLGTPERLQLTVDGKIGQVDLTRPATADALAELDLRIGASSPDLQRALAPLGLPYPIPDQLQLQASVTAKGQGSALRLQDGNARLSRGDAWLELQALHTQLTAESGWQPRQTRADVRIKVADGRQWREWLPQLPDYPLAAELRGTLQQTDADRFALTSTQLQLQGPGLDLSARGQARGLPQAPQANLSVAVITLDSGALLPWLAPQLTLPLNLSSLSGEFALEASPDALAISALQLGSTPDSPLALELSGALTWQNRGWQGEIEAAIASEDRAFLQTLSGLRLAPLSSDLRLDLDTQAIALTGDARFGATPLGIDLRATLRDLQLSGLDLALTAPTVHLADLGLQAELDVDEGYRPAQRLEAVEAERRNLQGLLDRLPRYPVTLTARIGHLEGEQSRFDDIRIQLSGRDGNFLLQEFDFRYDDALAQLRGVVDISVSPPGLSIAGDARSIPLNSLTRDLGFDNDITGTLHLRTGISGEGLDLDSLLASTDGSLSLALEDATIEGAAYDVLATDLLAWLYSGAAMEESTVIECTMADFQFRDGVATSDNLYAASARMVATGRARFDLGKRTLDVALTPRSRSRRLEIPSQITLKGDMASPRTWISPVTTTLDLTTEIVSLLPRMLLRLFGLGGGDRFADRDCRLPGPAGDRGD